MPSDPTRRVRLPSVAAKIRTIKGFRPEEKDLFLRIGSLVDAIVLNQRQVNNPGEVKGRRLANNVPSPQGVRVETVIGGLNVAWEAVDFSGISFYEVQFDSSSVFSNPITQQLVTTRISIRDVFNDQIFVRVRTVTEVGTVSLWSSTVSVTVEKSIWSVDQDFFEGENRTTVLPKPRTIGFDQDVLAGDLAFVGTGAAWGPGPRTFTDPSNIDPGIVFGLKDQKHQISYTLVDSGSGVENRLMGLPDQTLEQEMFYIFTPNFYININPYTGSFTDFFNVHSYVLSPSGIDVEFLRYIKSQFYPLDHFNTGVILNAVHSLIKF
jgi:hypothetical protein